jgi:hypothetical protein
MLGIRNVFTEVGRIKYRREVWKSAILDSRDDNTIFKDRISDTTYYKRAELHIVRLQPETIIELNFIYMSFTILA